MREELRHWLTMAQARTSRLKELHKQHPTLETRRPVLVVFNFDGFQSPTPGDPRMFINEWRYRETSIREMLALVMEEFQDTFCFLDHVVWNGERSLDSDLVCWLVILFSVLSNMSFVLILSWRSGFSQRNYPRGLFHSCCGLLARMCMLLMLLQRKV